MGPSDLVTAVTSTCTILNKSLMEEERGDFLGGPASETLNPNAGGPGVSSGQ